MEAGSKRVFAGGELSDAYQQSPLHDQTCVPNFEIVGWVERPEGLDQASEPQGQTTQPAATTPAATPVAPPAPAAPQPAQPDPMLETQF